MASTRLELPSEQSVGARYESLIRLADSIRAQHETEALFQVLVKELSSVIPFDAIAHCDESSKKVNWHLGESCQQAGSPPCDIQNEETLPGWVVENQKAAVIADVRQETRFPHSVAQLKKVGLQSACALPLSTAHRRLGSLVIASQKLDAIRKKRSGSYRWLRTRLHWRWTMPSIFRRRGAPRNAWNCCWT